MSTYGQKSKESYEKACLRLRDRDAIIVDENIIFRVYGYFHPPRGYICDVEYAPSDIFKSKDPRAIRQAGSKVFYKFYSDEGLRFILQHYPKYTVIYKPLRRKLVGVRERYIKEIRKPEIKLQALLRKTPMDNLLKALGNVIDIVTNRSGLSSRNFGVFGSLLHGFYHPEFSDIDLIIYGKSQLTKLRDSLKELYCEQDSPLKNEFENREVLRNKRWRFLNYSKEEFLMHQRRKMIYAVFYDKKIGRRIKVEFEPVKEWNEIYNEYDDKMKITKIGWIRAVAKVKDDLESPFMPSIYKIELSEILEGPKIDEVERILSYVEEFRMQAEKDELVLVEGNLEQVTTNKASFHQITLTYGPRYYQQVLKVIR